MTTETLPMPGPVVTPTARPAPRATCDSPNTLRAAMCLFWKHGSPRILAALVLASAAARVAVGGGVGWGDLGAIGVLLLFWPVQEWLIHVFLLHLRPFRLFGRVVDLKISRKHRRHHQDPFDIPLLFIPVQAYYTAPPLIVALWLALSPSLSVALTGIAVHFVLSLHYEWVHFIVHTRVVPRTWFYRRLWRNHRLHHFKNEQYWYGVSMLSGDVLLRTQPAAEQVPTSPLCFSLPAAP